MTPEPRLDERGASGTEQMAEELAERRDRSCAAAARPSTPCGEDIDDRGHCARARRRSATTALLAPSVGVDRGRSGWRRLTNRDDLAARMRKQIRPQRGDHEQNSEADRRGLCKDQPEAAHRRVPGPVDYSERAFAGVISETAARLRSAEPLDARMRAASIARFTDRCRLQAAVAKAARFRHNACSENAIVT